MVGRVFYGRWWHPPLDLAIATGVAVMAWQYVTVSIVDTALGFVMAGVLVFRRYAPLTVLGIVSTAALLQVFFGEEVPTPYDIAVLIAIAAVVTHARPLWHAYLAGGIGLLGVVVIAAEHGQLRLSSDGSGLEWDAEVFVLLTGTVAVWSTAFVLRTRRMYVASLEDRAATAERERDHLAKLAAADERAGIARELHDVVAHSLAVMIVQADGASYAIDSDRDRAREALRTIAGTGRDALDDMRRIVDVLRGTNNARTDMDRRKVGLNQLESLIERARSAGLEVDLRMAGQPAGLSAPDELTIFRIVQECLTNSLRHAGPGAKVTVSLGFTDGAVKIEVADDGAGRLAAPAGAKTNGSGGNGLIGMRERIAVHGGEFTAGPRLGTGWQVKAIVPVKGAA